MAKSRERSEAIAYRRRGKSIKWIANNLSVSQGSVSVWCRDVVLSSEQIELLEKNARDPNYGRRLLNSIRQREERISREKDLYSQGKMEVGKINKRELFLVGVGLYWAEGYKKDSQVGFGSSDPGMILFFIKWLKDYFEYRSEDLTFRVTVNEAHEYRIDEIISYWSNTLNVSREQFKKPFFQRVKWKKIYDNPNEYYGVLRVRVRRSSSFLRKILGMIGGLKADVERDNY
ncbi:MAG: hypothetical protein UY18_C0027G0009 [Microgenomates group bacterium GW2011_GWF2_47_9]|nr:MAG: hypothetical protein UY18_C0027G0009 [Microgenomates group bacterium GW2011_GWF2_47_9]